jgi:RHS repeat-associated protein
MTWFAWDGNVMVGEMKQTNPHHIIPREAERSREIHTVSTTQPNFKWQAQFYSYYLSSFVPLAMQTQTPEGKGVGESIYFYQNDPNGMPLRLQDKNGIITWEGHYSAFGQVDRLSVSLVKQPLRLQGQYFDAESGLHYNRYRYYDAGVGCFVSQDPIGLEGGDNPHQFAFNVLLWIDPLGLSGEDDPYHLHHTIPREIYNPRSGKPALLPEELADLPDIRGRAGKPNRWSIPADVHIDLHKKNRPGGSFNDRWRQELGKLDPDKSKWTKEEILSIRDKLVKEFGIDKYKPHPNLSAIEEYL